MTARNLASHINKHSTPQTKPIIGMDQVKNNAGGYVFETSKWDSLKRFLILGSEGGTYYVSERKLTADNAKNVIACIKEDGFRVIKDIMEISHEGRAPSNDPALLALALCAAHGSVDVKRSAFKALPHVARIGTHLFHFIEFLKSQRGWGRAAKNGVANWYIDMPVDRLAYQVVKYQQRDGWSHKDIMRLAHPNPERNTNQIEERKALFNWIAKRDVSEGNFQISSGLPAMVKAFELAKRATTAESIVNLIVDNGLPREAIPTTWLNHKQVWEALAENMPITAMVRNLGKMSSLGMTSTLKDKVIPALANEEKIRESRIHPLQLYMAYKTYSQGHGDKGSLSWGVNHGVQAALMEAFYLAFKTVTPANKRTMLALDVSGSMSMSNLANSNITPREASGIMAMVTARSEPWSVFKGFSNTFVDLKISPEDSLEQVTRKISGLPFRSTDCSLPMVWAKENNMDVDTFVVYTDNETYAGAIHPVQALKKYRDKTGIDAKLVVVGMASNGFTIADPKDKGSLDVVGFDTATPKIISDFSAGRLM